MAATAVRKTIVVTGVSRGLGRAMVEGFIDCGHTVFGCARSASTLDQLGTRWPAPHRFDVVDVAQETQVRHWAEQVLPAMPDGAPDLLVNNAALINRNRPLWEVPADEFGQVMDVNIKGVANVIRHFVPPMIQRGSGVIVNISSGWGRSVSAEVAPYCASKWAIEGMTRALAHELPRGMAAVALNPGVIQTAMLRSCLGAAAASCPDPRSWARSAVPLLLSLGPADNGQPRSVPS